MRMRKWLFPVIGLVLGCGGVLVAGEVALRVLGWGPQYYTFDPDTGYAIRPDASFTVPAGAEGGTRRIRSNSHGLRDVEHDYAKPPGTERILVLGDSFCEALQVDLEDTFFRRLQHRLDAGGSGRRWEVINTGVSGYGTDKELLYYRTEGRKYHPDWVVLMFVFNDVRNNDRAMQLAMSIPGRRTSRPNEPYFVLDGGELRLENYPASQSTAATFKMWLREHFYTYEFLWKLVKGAELSRKAVDADAGIPFDYTMYEAAESPEWDRAWRVTAALLRQLRSDVEADGAHFLVVGVTNDLQIHPDHLEKMFESYPAMRDVAWDWTKPDRLLRSICDGAGIEFLDLLEPFREHAEAHPREYLHTFGGHWTVAGHALCAEVLANRFLEDGPTPQGGGESARRQISSNSRATTRLE